jgi:hypothetical protein
MAFRRWVLGMGIMMGFVGVATSWRPAARAPRGFSMSAIDPENKFVIKVSAETHRKLYHAGPWKVENEKSLVLKSASSLFPNRSSRREMFACCAFWGSSVSQCWKSMTSRRRGESAAWPPAHWQNDILLRS